ncbi:MMPL family transporter [Paenibacillus marinisediminis]
MRETDRQGFFWRWGNGVFKHRRFIISLWIVLFVIMAAFAVQVPSMLKDDGFTPVGSESDVGLKLLTENMNIPSTSMDIVYESDDGSTITDEQSTKKVLDSLADLDKQPYVMDIAVKETGRLDVRPDVLVISVQMNLKTNAALDQFPSIRALIPDLEGMSTYVSGATPIYYDMQEASKRDIVKSEIIGLPIALIVLLIVFGTWIAGLLPLLVGLLSVTITLGLVYFIALMTSSLSNFLPNLISMLGLAVGIDYALFMVSRFREELHKQGNVQGAVAMTAQKAGQSIFFSGVAVLIGLIAMAFIDLNLFRSLALGGVMVVTISVIVSNTMLLAMLGVLGDKVNRYPVIPTKWRRSKGNAEMGQDSKVWGKIAHAVMKRPIIIASLLTVGFIACAWPVSDIKIGIPDAEMLPPKYESRYGSDLINEVYDMRETEAMQVLLRMDKPYSDGDTVNKVKQIAADIASLDSVKSVNNYLGALQALPSAEAKALALQNPNVQAKLEQMHLVKGEYVLLQVIPTVQPDSDEAYNLVRELREMDMDATESYVTGATAFRLDIIDRITDALPYVVLFILAVTYIVLFIAFRSVLLPLKAVLMNVLSLGASLGIVVLVFQYGVFADLFQVTSTGMVVAMLPVIIFCVVFGISMDYEVFLLSRIAEEYERTGDNEHSTAEGLIKTGGIITSAAFILIVVVGAFIFTDNEMMKAVGLGLATSIFLDATLIRVFLVPALMKLLGKANWWAPRWFKSHLERDAA